MTIDMSDTIVAKSDQQNYVDYLGGPKTVTITAVRKPGGDQPIEIDLEGMPGRPLKPSKTVRRVLVAAWGSDGSQYVGRSMTLYGDPDVTWAGKKVGGIRVSHLSHIDGPKKVELPIRKGVTEAITIQPLVMAAPDPAPYLEAIDAAEDEEGLRHIWAAVADAGLGHAPQIIAAKDAKKAALAPTTETDQAND